MDLFLSPQEATELGTIKWEDRNDVRNLRPLNRQGSAFLPLKGF